jgi:hypothetical protein
VPILLKNDFGPLEPEDFQRNTPQSGILIQEIGLSDSEILYFLRLGGTPSTFSTVSVIMGH